MEDVIVRSACLGSTVHVFPYAARIRSTPKNKNPISIEAISAL